MAGVHDWILRLTMLIVYAAWFGTTIPAMAASDNTVITNRLVGVPAGYGTLVKFLRQKNLPERELSRAHAAESVQSVGSAGEKIFAIPISQSTEPGRQLPWRKLLVFVAASIGGLYTVTKAAGSITSPLLGRIIYLAFFCGIFLFAYTSHAESLMTTCCSVKERVLGLLEYADIRLPPSVAAN